MSGSDMIRGAQFSDCRRYRYTLYRGWEPGKGYAMFVGLNPSTADETQDDATIRRCIAFARAWGYGALCMTNLFGYRAKKPIDMLYEADPVGPACDHHLKLMSARAGVVVAAWGTHGKHSGRDKAVRALLPDLHYLRLTKDGFPGHPLYLPGNLTPTPWK